MGPRVRVSNLCRVATQSALRAMFLAIRSGEGAKARTAHEIWLTKVPNQFRSGAASLHQDGNPGCVTLNAMVFVCGLGGRAGVLTP